MSLRTLDRGTDYYTVDSVGRTQEVTPEGYLLCRDVPVSRTGTMLYAAGEIRDDAGNKLEPGPDGVIRVFRDESEVFRPETIASLNGKDVVDDHPDEDVSPENWGDVSVGVVLNPRRGQGVDDQMLLADFLIKTKLGIAAVKSGKREVSCGYDASYEQTEPGAALQRKIVYNHVALVDHGRCGPRCSIGDEDMKVKVHQSFTDRLLALVRSRDEEGVKEMLKGVEGADDDPAGGGQQPDPNGDQHFHIHLPGGSASPEGDAAPAAAEAAGGPAPAEGEQGQDLPDWFKQHAQSTSDRFDRIEGVLAKLAPPEQAPAADEGAVDPAELQKEPDGTPVKDSEPDPTELTKVDQTGEKGRTEPKSTTDTTKDAASRQADFQDAVAKAEIICPGVTLPTYDANAGVNATCLLRRRVLAKALRTDDVAAGIVRRIMGDTPNLVGLTCDAITSAFNAVAELAGSRNNGIITGTATYDRLPKGGEKGPPTIAELNKRHREFWKDRV